MSGTPPQPCGVTWSSGPFGDKDCVQREISGPCVCGQPTNLRAHGPYHRCRLCHSRPGSAPATEESLKASGDRLLPGGLLVVPRPMTARQKQRFERRFHLARHLPVRLLNVDGSVDRTVGRRLPWWRWASIKVRMWLA